MEAANALMATASSNAGATTPNAPQVVAEHRLPSRHRVAPLLPTRVVETSTGNASSVTARNPLAHRAAPAHPTMPPTVLRSRLGLLWKTHGLVSSRCGQFRSGTRQTPVFLALVPGMHRSKSCWCPPFPDLWTHQASSTKRRWPHQRAEQFHQPVAVLGR